MAILGGTSKGNQRKFRNGDNWIKIDTFCESLAEVIVCKYLYLFQFELPLQIVHYNPVLGGNEIGCISKNFLGVDEKVKTVYRILLNRHSKQYYDKFKNNMVDEYNVLMQEILPLNKEFGIYFTELLLIDCLIRNRDRHTNNIALICNKAEELFRLAPVFDNGDSLFQREMYGLSAVECLNKFNVAKPFGETYDKQLQLAMYYFPAQVQILSDILDLRDLDLSIYPTDVVKRAVDTLRYTTRRYFNIDLNILIEV